MANLSKFATEAELTAAKNQLEWVRGIVERYNPTEDIDIDLRHVLRHLLNAGLRTLDLILQPS